MTKELPPYLRTERQQWQPSGVEKGSKMETRTDVREMSEMSQEEINRRIVKDGGTIAQEVKLPVTGKKKVNFIWLSPLELKQSDLKYTDYYHMLFLIEHLDDLRDQTSPFQHEECVKTHSKFRARLAPFAYLSEMVAVIDFNLERAGMDGYILESCIAHKMNDRRACQAFHCNEQDALQAHVQSFALCGLYGIQT